MNIYCKPYLNHLNKVDGSVESIEFNITSLPEVLIDDIWTQKESKIKIMVDIIEDGEVVGKKQDVDEDGNLLYDIVMVNVLKDCVVKFEATDSSFLSRSVAGLLESTYWDGNFGIRSNYNQACSDFENGTMSDKCRIICDKIELKNIKKSIVLRDIQMFEMIYAGQGVNIHE